MQRADTESDPTVVIGSVQSVQGSMVLLQLSPAAVASGRALEIGEVVLVPAGANIIVGAVHALRRGRRSDDERLAEIHLLGELRGDHKPPRFSRGVSVYPVLDAPAVRASPKHIGLIFARQSESGIRIGTLRHAPGVPACALVDPMLGKHFAILGSTGSGKSCAVTVLVSAMLDQCPASRVLILDPHGEYAAAFRARAELLDPSNLELPYWLMNFEETASILAPGEDRNAQTEAHILKDAILAARKLWAGSSPGSVAGPISVDTPVPYRLSDLVKVIDDAMGQINKADSIAAYRQLLGRIESIRNDRRYGFLFQSLYVRDNMDAVLGRLFRMPVDGKPVGIVDLSGMPGEVIDVVVSVICRLIFEFGLWSARDTPAPILLICEEAHRYLPAAPGSGFAPSRRAIERIAKEGRKYGISLGLVSQRPAELSATSVSQCGTIMALRMTNEADQSFVRNILPDGTDWLIRCLPSLGTGEAIMVGDGAPVPMQLLLNQLLPGQQPASRTPPFSRAWQSDNAGLDLLRVTIRRWREQRR